MKNLHNENEIQHIRNDNIISLIYFSGVKCGACEAIKLKVEKILEKYPNIICGEVNGEEHPELGVLYGVFSLPILLLFIEGKETIRVGRNVDLLELEENIQRYYKMIY